MFQTKVITYLRSFDNKELKKFKCFLESPFFFQGRKIEDVIDFVNYLTRFQPDYEHPKLSKEKIFSKVFPELPYQERRFQHLMTKANKTIEQFISVYYRPELFGCPPSDLSFLFFYRKKNMSEQFQKAHQKAILRQSTIRERDSSHYWVDYLLARELTEQNSIFNNRETNLKLPQTLSSLDTFFMVAKLESACVLLNQIKHQVPLDSKENLKSLEVLLPLSEKKRFQKEPLLDLLYKTYILLQEHSTDDQYRELKKAYDQQYLLTGLSQRQIIHGAMRNFCVQQFNNGKKEYLEEIFILYQEGLFQGVLDSGGGLMPPTFKNMVRLGISFKKYEWVEQFLEDYRYRLIGTEEAESIYSLNRANLLFAQAKYEEALDFLTYNFADIYMKLNARRMEVQIYYELDSPLLDSKIQAFKIFVFRISKSRITKVQREAYRNFINLLKQIIHPSTFKNPQRISVLKRKIEEKKTVSEKNWLLCKLVALSK